MPRLIPKPGLALPGGFVLDRALGRGVGTEVWTARRPGGPEGEVAVKILLDKGKYARLCAQAAAMGRLVGTGRTLRLVAAHLYDDPPFLAQEPVLPASLAARFAGGPPVGAAEALGVAADVLRALVEAHARGVPHGGLKPTNVLLDAAGRAFVGDFGGGLLSLEGLDAAGVESAAVRVGAAAAFVAPEVAAGAPPTVAADLYSAGALIRDLFRSEPPPALVEVVARATAPEPGPRPASASEMLAAVEEATDSHGKTGFHG